jgi:hypothetical protein
MRNRSCSDRDQDLGDEREADQSGDQPVQRGIDGGAAPGEPIEQRR